MNLVVYMRLRELLLFTVLGLVCVGTSHLLYRNVIVPQLPELTRVTEPWWFITLAPISTLFLYVGWRSTQWRNAFPNGLIAFWPTVLLLAGRSFFTGQPVSHGPRPGGGTFWIAALSLFGLLILVMLLGATLKRILIKHHDRPYILRLQDEAGESTYEPVSKFDLEIYACGLSAGDQVRLTKVLPIEDPDGTETHRHEPGEIWTVLTGSSQDPEALWLRQPHGELHSWDDSPEIFQMFERVNG